LKRWSNFILGALISAVTLVYALSGQDFSKIGAELANANYWWLIPTYAISVLGLGFRGMRWRTLLSGRAPWRRLFNIMNVGYFLNAFLPLRLGEVGRSFLLMRLKPPIPLLTGLSSIVVERLIDLLSVVCLVLLAIALAPIGQEFQRGAMISGGIGIAGIFALALLANRRAWAHGLLNNVFLRLFPFARRLNPAALLDKILDGFALLSSVRQTAAAVLWTALAWATSVIAGYWIMLAFYPQASWQAALLVISAGSIAIALPAVPGSVGPFEAAVIVGLQAAGMVGGGNTSERAFAFAVVLHMMNVSLYAVSGMIGLFAEKVSFQEVLQGARQLSGRNKEAEAQATESESKKS
jgi:glycosyltransferase 2 family protein